MSNWLKKEEGSGLILAIMTLMVLLVLGISIGTITISGHRMSHTNRDSISAYYIAEAGANLAYEDMKSIVKEMYNPDINQDTFFGAIEEKFESEISTYNEFKTQFGYDPKANINIVPPDDDANPRVYTIESVSTIGNHSRTAQKEVTVSWIGNEDDGDGVGTLPSIPAKTSLIAKNSIKLVGGASIYDDVYIDASESFPFVIDGGGRRYNGTTFYNDSIEEKQVYKYPDWYNHIGDLHVAVMEKTIPWGEYYSIVNSFPEYDDYPDFRNYPMAPTNFIKDDIVRHPMNGNIHKIVNNGNVLHNNYITDKYEINISEDTKIRNIVVSSPKQLFINTGSNDVSIYIDNINISNGALVISGTGNVNVFVKEKVTISQSDFDVHNLSSFKMYANEIDIKGKETNFNTMKSISLSAKENMKFDNVNLKIKTTDNIQLHSKSIDFSNISSTFSNSNKVNIFAQNKYSLNSGNLAFKDINNVNLHTNNMEHNNGHLDTINTEFFSMFVRDEMTFGSGSINKSGESNKFLIYYENDNEFDFGGSINLYASLFFKQADISIGSGVKTFGPIATGGGKVKLSGGSSSSPLILAPKSKVEVIGGANFKGILITDSISLDGGTSIKHEEYDHKLFPFGGVPVKEEIIIPDIEDIISSEPTKEP
ncbi:hypothetical protein GCM10008932_13200 [Alkalibacterium iburiense]|uniref:Type 4 fimbrial biogenesis protein PilX N-terminal domain-containing protein n=1 Tax=Alkalibacterium iburiense TaxID=290589 RepID=A0ABN0XEW9_9LACT